MAGIILAGLTILYSAAFGANIFARYNPVVSVAGNVIILGLFFLFAVQSRIVSPFKARPVVVLGQASYSLYLLHQFIGISVMRVLIRNGLPYLLALPVTIALVIALAVAMFKVVEVPAKAAVIKHTKSWINSISNSAFTFRPVSQTHPGLP